MFVSCYCCAAVCVRLCWGGVPSPVFFIKVTFLGEVMISPAVSEAEKGVRDISQALGRGL